MIEDHRSLTTHHRIATRGLTPAKAGDGIILTLIPALKRWAKFKRPLRGRTELLITLKA